MLPHFRFPRPFAALLVALAAMACQAHSAPLPIAAEDDAGPWSYRDGSGFANDVVEAAFKAAGEPIAISVMPYARCKEYVLRGQVAAAFSMSWLDSFKGQVLFPAEPLFSCHADYFFNPARPLKAVDEQGLAPGTRIGIVLGYEYPPSLYRLQAKGRVILEASESEDLNLKKLMLGRIDAALINYNGIKPAELMMAQAGVLGHIQRAFRCGELKSYIGFSVKSPRGADALRAFERGYQMIRTNGTLQQIEAKWAASAKQKVAALSSTHG
jgi:polar amino acid transport system substrate-binding protein